MEVFILCLLVLLAVINLIVAISSSMVLIKVYEISLLQEQRYESQRQARGLVDIPYRPTP